MNKRKWLIFGGLAIVVVIVGSLLLFIPQSSSASAASNSIDYEAATLGSITDVIGGTGTVRAKQTSTLIWQTSGVVEKILVDEQEQVSDDQALARLESASLSQSVLTAQGELISYQQQLEDLYDNANLDYAEAKLEVINAQDALKDLKDDRNWLNYPRCDQDTIDDYWKDYENKADQVKDIEGMYDGSNAAILEMLTNTKSARDTAYANYNYCKEPRTENEIDKADTEISQAQANLDIAQRKLDAMTPGKPNANDVAALEAKISATETLINMAVLKSPFAGTVSEISIQPGDQVSSGSSAFRIDDLSKLLVDVNISEVDINRVALGQSAVITFDAAYGKEYQGTVSKIASVGTTNQGVVEFMVTIAIDDPDQDIKPGMTAVVNITLSKLENVLLVPNQAVRVVDNERVVYTRTGSGTLQAIGVTLGVSSDSYSQVLGGDLKAGDMIALNPPEDITSLQAGAMGAGIGQR